MLHPCGKMGDVSIGPAPSPQDRVALASALEGLHVRLSRQFETLSAERKERNAVVFALEHGLGDGERAVLNNVVRSCIRLRMNVRRNWLPIVVHAAEVGYSYDGDEYWPTLERNCPGWEAHLGRQFMSQRFREFSQSFCGAQPRGSWAGQFSIIAWPITHAILPTDLQRQLARVLYDSRGVLTTALLSDSEALGAVLAARSSYASRRFQQFAENGELLGQVAAALLSDSVEDSSLLPAALSRIVEDLTAERQAKVWLHAARSSAQRIRLRGLARGSTTRGPGTTSGSGGRLTDCVTSPIELLAEPGSAGWRLKVVVPDFTPLLERHPEFSSELRSIRCRVNGASSRPQPRGWLLSAGSTAIVESWPTPGSPVFDLERPAQLLRDCMTDEATFPSTPTWLFKLDEDSLGRHIRSGALQAGSSYLVVGDLGDLGALEPGGWIVPAALDCAGANAVTIVVPKEAGAEEHRLLQTVCGLGLQSSVRLQPVGLPPAAWDGQGYGEWILGDRPLLHVHAPHDISACTVTVDDGQPHFMNWRGALGMFIRLPELTEGPHVAILRFVSADSNVVIPEGRLDLRIRPPQPYRPTGTVRDPLRLRVWPPVASLEQLWDSQATLEIQGAAGAQVRCTISLEDREGDRLHTRTRTFRLPVEAASWSDFFVHECREQNEFSKAYDDSSRLSVAVDGGELGRVRHRFDRELLPLRWVFRYRGGEPSLRLRESADTGEALILAYSSFESPGTVANLTADQGELYVAAGGLIAATIGDYRSAIVVPRRVHDLNDLRAPTVGCPPVERTPDGVSTLITIANRWFNSRTPGDIVASQAREEVLAAVCRAVSSLIGGALWRSLETKGFHGARLVPADWLDGLAKPGSWMRFRRDLRDLAALRSEGPPKEAFAALLEGGASVRRTETRIISSRTPTSGVDAASLSTLTDASASELSEFLLRLASAPGTVDCSQALTRRLLPQILEHPVLYRAARFLAVTSVREGVGWEW